MLSSAFETISNQFGKYITPRRATFSSSTMTPRPGRSWPAIQKRKGELTEADNGRSS
jgi:hypothetical protein